MKLSLPAEFSDLTLQGLMVLNNSKDPVDWLVACGEVSPEYVRKMPLQLFTKAKEHLETIQKAETSKHPITMIHNGVEYGFIPSWAEFSTGEWIDIEMWAEDFWGNADRIMSLLYRPITNKVGSRYEIEEYTAKEDRTIFHDLSATYFSGAMLFFCSSRNRLLNDSRQSLVKIAEEGMTRYPTNGDGTITSTISRGRTFSRWMQSHVNQLKSYFSISHT